MKKFSTFLSFLKAHKLPLAIITLLTIIIWYPLLNQTFFGEGYYYFDRGQDFISANGHIADYSEYDIFARVLFDVAPPFFHDNIVFYMTFQLISMVLLNMAFYFFVLKNTKEKLLSMVATMFFLGSYIGLFEMLGTGNYQRFVQRVPNLGILFISLIFFIKFLELRKTIELLKSFLLFSLATYIAHFSTFITPFYVVYAIAFSIHQKEISLKQKILNLLATTPFIAFNQFLINADHLRPTNHVSDWLDHAGTMLKNITLQFGALNTPPFLISKIAAITQPYDGTVLMLTIPVIVVYIVMYFLIRKKHPKMATIYLSSFLFIFVVLVLNTYIGKIDPLFDFRGYHYYFLPPYFSDSAKLLTNIKGDRYYLVPMFFVSICWTIGLWTLLKTNQARFKIFSIVIAVYLLYNTSLIWSNFSNLNEFSDETKSYVSYVVSRADEFSNKTTLVAPTYFMWPSSMLRVFHGYPEMQFVALKPGWENQVDPSHKNNLIIIDYNHKSKQFIDLTEQYKKSGKLPTTLLN